jgi:hypothetical protein
MLQEIARSFAGHTVLLVTHGEVGVLAEGKRRRAQAHGVDFEEQI